MSVTDFHNHLIPGVDDGARTADDSATALAAMVAEGVSAVITTPHVDASLVRRPDALATRLAELDAGWERLQPIADAAGVPVQRGCEMALDTPDPDFADPRLRLAGTDFVLVEFAYMTVPPNAAAVLRKIREGGWIPVLAHPERYGALAGSVDVAAEWRRAGALLQVNGASLIGRYGPEPKRAAEQILAAGWADYICSDYHTRSGPWIARYRQWLREHNGSEQCTLLTEVNPRRLLDGELPIPVPPLLARQHGLWQRVRSMFR
jgi:protein-tyrosine phosphatase